ncbi:MAG: putative Ig domain-containing protein, partial [Burkholderiales bacterium]
IKDDGTGDYFAADNNTATPALPTGTVLDDDRPLTVNDITVSESSPFVVFTVTGQPGQKVALELESGTATVGTDTGSALEYFDGTTWKPYTPGSFVAIPAGGNTLLVRVAVVNDPTLEGPETFRLRATNAGGTPARGTATLTDDGSNGNFFGPDNNTGTPAVGIADDDRAKPVPPAPAVVPPPAAPIPIALPPEAPLPPPQRFDSAITPVSPNRMLVMDRPPIGDILTRVEGFRIRVMEADLPMLMRDKGITDQFVENGRSTSFAMPYDAFMHSRDDAVVTMSARLTDGRALPGWIRFNAQAGTFQIDAPAGLVEEYEILVTARDNNGREATASFKLNVGAGKRSEGVPTERNASWERFAPAGRPGLSAQLRDAGKAPGLLERIMASQAVQERLQAGSDPTRAVA